MDRDALQQNKLNVMRIEFNNSKIELIWGNITNQEVDAVVNAADALLAGGGGSAKTDKVWYNDFCVSKENS